MPISRYDHSAPQLRAVVDVRKGACANLGCRHRVTPNFRSIVSVIQEDLQIAYRWPENAYRKLTRVYAQRGFEIGEVFGV